MQLFLSDPNPPAPLNLLHTVMRIELPLSLHEAAFRRLYPMPYHANEFERERMRTFPIPQQADPLTRSN